MIWTPVSRGRREAAPFLLEAWTVEVKKTSIRCVRRMKMKRKTSTMFKKISITFFIVFIILNVSNYAFAGISDWWQLINLRYSGVLGLNSNYTLQTTPFPLQVTAGLGTGGYKAGIGLGDAGNIDNNNTGELEAGSLGGGIKLSYLKSWKDGSFPSDTNKKHIGKWIGIEVSMAFIFGIDIGYYKSLIAGNKETLSTINVGLFY